MVIIKLFDGSIVQGLSGESQNPQFPNINYIRYLYIYMTKYYWHLGFNIIDSKIHFLHAI